jgi:predicted TPR repeat methyltransferase
MDDSQLLFDKAIELHRAGDVSNARKLYLSLIETHPNLADAWHLCGMTFYQEGSFSESECYVRKAIEIRYASPAFHSNLGLILMRLGRSEEAIDSYISGLVIDPQFTDAMLNLGNAYIAVGEADKAAAALKNLLELDPNHAEACNSLAMLLAASDQAGQALELLEKALVRRPDYPDCQLNIARLLGRLGRQKEAVEHLRMTSDAHPDDPLLQHDLGLIYQNMGMFESALHCCSRALELDDRNASNFVRLGNVQQSAGLWEEAEASYHKALQLDPSNTNALNDLGTVSMQRDDFSEASKFFDAALQYAPDFANAVYNSGTAEQALGHMELAEHRFVRAIALNPQFSEAYRCLSDIYRATGREEDARKILGKWVTNVPDDPAAVHLLAASGKQNVAPARASDAYVKIEFDRFAESFDKTLERLEYCAPEKIVGLLGRHGGLEDASSVVLDAGCGTGLGAVWLRSFCSRLVGVDLSPKMIEKARSRDLYDELAVGELVEFMDARSEVFDLIVSADTLVYFGDLDEVFAAAARSLKSSGRFAFSLEDMEPGGIAGFRLNASGRYCHNPEYVRRCLSSAGLDVLAMESDVLRCEMRQPVSGLVVVAVKS